MVFLSHITLEQVGTVYVLELPAGNCRGPSTSKYCILCTCVLPHVVLIWDVRTIMRLVVNKFDRRTLSKTFIGLSSFFLPYFTALLVRQVAVS